MNLPLPDNSDLELAAAHRKIEQQASLISAIEARIEDLQSQLSAMKNSASWRLTHPLRLLEYQLSLTLQSPLVVQLRAVWRHPRNAAKQKAFRDQHTSRRRMSLAGLSDSISSLSITAIVPNFNHAPYLRERIASIVEQSHSVAEIIILDDASTDDSRTVIEAELNGVSVPVVTVFNDENSGNVFRQWSKGIALAKSDLVWICESDDTCDRSFLARLVQYFADSSVMLAFGRIGYIDEQGRNLKGLDDYYEAAAPRFWKKPRIESASTWFRGPFGIRNVIPNVGGCLFRRQQISPQLLAELVSYRVCGDWYLYSRLAHGGRIAYEPAALAYFRQHSTNTSLVAVKSESFFEEHFRIAKALRQHYGTGTHVAQRMMRHVRDHYAAVFGDGSADAFDSQYPIAEIAAERRTTQHIVMAIYSLETGGGELFPIHLANALSQRGYDVTLLVWTIDHANYRIRRLVAPEIPILTKRFVDSIGFSDFLQQFAVSIIHSHNIYLDRWFREAGKTIRTPYVVTHHGSYESATIDADFREWLLGNVDQWIFIADKNLGFLEGAAPDPQRFTKLANAMPTSNEPFPFTRTSLGIEPNAFVFGLASRALIEKGWETAIVALRSLRARTKRPLYLLLCGDGRDLSELQRQYSDEPGVRFLGYQDAIHGFYRLCDCCVLPTRFAGESYPLTLIQAIQAGIPAIATDVGEIHSILRINGRPLGIVVPGSDEPTSFEQAFERAMERILDDEIYESLKTAVRSTADDFSMDRLVSDYEKIYGTFL